MRRRKRRLLKLLTALAHDASRDEHEAADDLREAGLDPTKIKLRGIEFVKTLKNKQPKA